MFLYPYRPKIAEVHVSGLGLLLATENETVAFRLDEDMVVFGKPPFKNLHCQWILQMVLNGPLQGTRAKDRIIAAFHEKLFGALADMQRNIAFLQTGRESLELNVDDMQHIFLGKASEDYRFVDPIEKLGLELVVENFFDLCSDFIRPGMLFRHFHDKMTAKD